MYAASHISDVRQKGMIPASGLKEFAQDLEQAYTMLAPTNTTVCVLLWSCAYSSKSLAVPDAISSSVGMSFAYDTSNHLIGEKVCDLLAEHKLQEPWMRK